MRNNYADCHAVGNTYKHTPSANTDAVITVTADSNQFWVLDWIAFSYDGNPTGGKITVEIGGVVAMELSVTSAGLQHLDFSTAPVYTETKNQSMVITLAAGGAGVTGKLVARIR